MSERAARRSGRPSRGWLRWRWTIGRRLVGGFAVALVLLAGVGGVSYENTRRLISNQGEVDRTRDLMESLTAMWTALQNAESSERGYLIAGDEAALAAYKSSRADVDNTLDRVSAQVHPDLTERDLMRELRPVVDARFAVMQRTIDLRREQGFASARAQVVSGQGQRLMAGVSAAMGQMLDQESKVVAQRLAQARALSASTKSVVFGGTALAALLLLGLAVLLTRGITRPVNELS